MSPKNKSTEEFGVLKTPSPQSQAAGSQSAGSPDSASNGRSSSEASAAATLDRVRDLLFGDASRAHDERLSALQDQVRKDMDQLNSAFDERVTALRTEMRGEVEAILGRLDEQGRDKVERTDLRSMLSDLADRIGGSSAEGQG